MLDFRHLFRVLACLSLIVGALAGAVSSSPARAQALDYDIPNGHFFTQANGFGGAGGLGFAVTDDNGIQFWSEFQRLGGLEAIGYPISTRFNWNGFTVQAFQKVVLQWRPEVGEAYFVNVIDEMHDLGFDALLRDFKSTPAIADWSADTGLTWDEIVARHLAVLDANPAIKAKYFEVADPTLLYGLPMAPLADYGNVVVLRAQRVIIQQWTEATPWANAGDVQIANGADVAKELGLFDRIDRIALTPQPPPGQLPAPTAALPRYGITADPASSEQVRRVREAGAATTILAAVWREVEPQPTSPAGYNWAPLDRLFASTRQAGLTPIVVFTGNPTWAWADGPNGIIRPDQLPEFAEFVGAVVERYRGDTKYWSFYNEPDCNGPVTPEIHAACWGNHGPAYANMLRAVYPAIKRADPAALVIFGGIAFDNFADDRAHARGFLEATLAAGAAEAFDVFNFHYYTGFRSVWEPYGTDIQGKTNFLRGILEQHGVRKPIILTEIGSGVTRPDESEELQARYVAQAYIRGFAAGLETIFWYDLADPGPYGFGLLRADLQPRPAYAAYQTLVATVGNRPFRRTIGAGELGATGVEAYEFGGSDGRRVIVAWSTDGGTHSIRIAGNSGRVVQLTGEAAPLAASGGSLTATVGPRPIYLDVS